MNTDLIKQLRLAIEVEEGKVPLSETQWKRKDVPESHWEECALGPEEWNYETCQYRRKPKPLECWIAEYDSCLKRLLWESNHEPISRPPDAGKLVRLVKMREVTNE